MSYQRDFARLNVTRWMLVPQFLLWAVFVKSYMHWFEVGHPGSSTDWFAADVIGLVALLLGLLLALGFVPYPRDARPPLEAEFARHRAMLERHPSEIEISRMHGELRGIITGLVLAGLLDSAEAAEQRNKVEALYAHVPHE